jgi:hypothetical protein
LRVRRIECPEELDESDAAFPGERVSGTRYAEAMMKFVGG